MAAMVVVEGKVERYCVRATGSPLYSHLSRGYGIAEFKIYMITNHTNKFHVMYHVVTFNRDAFFRSFKVCSKFPLLHNLLHEAHQSIFHTSRSSNSGILVLLLHGELTRSTDSPGELISFASIFVRTQDLRCLWIIFNILNNINEV